MWLQKHVKKEFAKCVYLSDYHVHMWFRYGTFCRHSEKLQGHLMREGEMNRGYLIHGMYVSSR